VRKNPTPRLIILIPTYIVLLVADETPMTIRISPVIIERQPQIINE
jgi:hypothetical protein